MQVNALKFFEMSLFKRKITCIPSFHNTSKTQMLRCYAVVFMFLHLSDHLSPFC